jgi:Mg-chelatase subunit ChlD
VEQARKRTTSRRELARNPRFEQISPDVGELDEAAVDEAMADDPDDVLALLADLTGATDPRLRELSKRIAGRLYLDIARRGPTKPRGTGRLAELPYRPDRGDLDLDASLEIIAAARAAGEAVDPDRLRVRAWSTPATAICLLVDRSGSMEGRPLATSAVAAAAVSWRAPADYSVLSFGKDVIAAKSQDRTRPVEHVVDAVLALRGFGTTDLARALRSAGEQLARSPAGRRIAVLLSDCRATEPGDVVGAAAALDELVIVAPDGDSDAAEQLAAQVGARLVTVTGPASVADALARALDE